MTPSRLLLPAAGTLLAAGALAAVFLLPETRATPPQEFADLAEHCRTFTSMKAYVGIDGRSMLVHAVEDGRFAADVFGGQTRYAWDGSMLWWDSTAVEPQPKREAVPFIEDLWAECRSGFANSTWTDVTEQRKSLGPGGLYGAKKWARLDLPFVWAQGIEIYVGVVPESGKLRVIRYGVSGQTEWGGAVVTETYWTATFPPQALDKHAPPFAPPEHPSWLHPEPGTYPTLEGENKFANIEDLLNAGE